MKGEKTIVCMKAMTAYFLAQRGHSIVAVAKFIRRLQRPAELHFPRRG